MAKKQFKAESKKLLDLMINSIYTHKEIFLREIISNASDAMDKRYYLSLTEKKEVLDKKDLAIKVELDNEKKTITIIDQGIGLDKTDMENNLGVIAKSDSQAFKEMMESKKDVDIIGQFGVGFYSAFMVAKKLEVYSKKYNSDQGYLWVSEGEDGYSIKESDISEVGTKIVIHVKEDTKEEKYSEYLEEFKVKELIKKYSDYISYPIQMLENEEFTTINSMIPLWKRNKRSIKADEYGKFYQENFFDYQDPLQTIHFKVEGSVSFDALLFIPSHTPHNYYSKEYERGLKLYSRNVFIQDHTKELIPEYFQFVRGLVDTQDLSLNISREMLQHNRQLKVIENKVTKKIKNELEKMLKNDKEKYLEFYQAFGLQLKYGIYSEFGAHKETLQDLIMFYSSSEKALVTLKEYVSKMSADQEFIYFASGESVDKIDLLPQLEVVKEKGYEVLYLTDDIDEFALNMLREYDGKSFKSVNQGNLDLEDDKTKKKVEKLTGDNQGLFDLIKETLSDKISNVKLSTRLKKAPVCLSSDEGVSLEMEKVLNQMPDGQNVKANKVLEINSEHAIFKALVNLYDKDQSKVKDYADLLYNQALLIEGFSIDNPVEFSNKMVNLMLEASEK
ncbi:MAG: molecular chaperone HtpG [Erysipelotrichaceae bacterium]